jgi:predicted flap endonuclease-1-like 5' DNA nuclease
VSELPRFRRRSAVAKATRPTDIASRELWRYFLARRTVPALVREGVFQMLALTWDFHGLTWLAAIAAFILGWLFTMLFWKKGKTHEEVLRRVVETSTDESTRLKTLADEHGAALKLKDDALLRVKGDHDAELVALRTDRDKALADMKARELEVNTFKTEVATHKAEATKLQGLVGTVDTSKKEIDDLRAQLAKQQSEYELSIGDWRKKVEAGEAAKVAAEQKHTEIQGLLGSAKSDNDKVLLEWRTRAEKAEQSVAESAKVTADWQAKFTAAEAAKVTAEKRIVDLDASHARVLGEWQSKVTVAEQQRTEVQGLMGSAKADNDRVLVEWRTRAEKAEGELGNWSRRYADLETSTKSAGSDHERVLGEWRVRAEKAEADAVAAAQSNANWNGRYQALEADRNKINADWDGRYKALEADRNKINADWQARFTSVEAAKVAAEQKHFEVQGLLGSAKTDNDNVLAEWRTRTEKAEADAAAAAKVNADWDGRYKALEADRNKINADWQARYESLEADHSGSVARVQAAEAKHAEVQGLLGTHQSELSTLKGQLAEATAGPDDLKVIEGIGPKIDQALRADGLTRWIHVRDASQDRLKSAIEKAGISFAPSMTTWSKQASYLVAGDQAGFKQYTEYLVSGQDPSALGAEELTGNDRVQALASGTVFGSGNVEVEELAKTKDGSDNLLIIEGIGPKFNDALKAAGLGTFAKVAAASEDQLRDAIKAAGLSFAPSLTSWAEQADLLNKGDMDGFRALTARLVAGRKD